MERTYSWPRRFSFPSKKSQQNSSSLGIVSPPHLKRASGFTISPTSTRKNFIIEQNKENLDFFFTLVSQDDEKEKIEKYAEENYLLESIRFIQDVITWKRIYYEKDARWRRTKAEYLHRTYIEIASPFQVNISEIHRKEIEQIILNKEMKLEEDIFDDSLYSVSWMIYHHEGLAHFIS